MPLAVSPGIYTCIVRSFVSCIVRSYFVSCVRLIKPMNETNDTRKERDNLFQMYTPCRTNASDLYTLQDKRFRFIHPARHTFQNKTPCKTGFSDLYRGRSFVDRKFVNICFATSLSVSLYNLLD
jgi:hypothetical protein